MAVITTSNINDNSINETVIDDLLLILFFSAMPLSDMYSLYRIIPIMKSNSRVNGLAYSIGFTKWDGKTAIRHIYNKNTMMLIDIIFLLSACKMNLFNEENTA